MRRERRQRGEQHEDRAPVLLAALEALDAVPVRYAGTVRGVRVMTRETVDALVVAVSEVRRVLATLDQCRGLKCEECALLWSAWRHWRGDGALDYGMAGWEAEKYGALVASSHSGDWPDKFIAEWRWWADRLPPGIRA